MCTGKQARKYDGTNPHYVSLHKAVFPVTRFGCLRLTLDCKKEIPTDTSSYIRHVTTGEELSKEEVLYLVKRVNELEDSLSRLKEIINHYE